jgi:hypothetical protein
MVAIHNGKITNYEPNLLKTDELSESTGTAGSIAEYNFSKESPCMYEGKVLCRDCPRDECDMAAGRELHQEYFVKGWVAARKQ